MNIPIRILIIEDSESDTQLLLRYLTGAGYKPAYKRIETADSMREALKNELWDIILSDYNMPKFDAPRALDVLKESALDIPFIVISGGIGEDKAVDMMKYGCQDYIMKNNMSRLASAIQRELVDVRERRVRRRTEEALSRSKEKYKYFVEHVSEGVSCFLPFEPIDMSLPQDDMIHRILETVCIECNKTFAGIYNKDQDDIFGLKFSEIIGSSESEIALLRRFIENSFFIDNIEIHEYDPAKNEKWYLKGIFVEAIENMIVRLWIRKNDITERKMVENELNKYREHLEDLVKERTINLEKANIELQGEITERRRMESELARERNLLRTLIDSVPDQIYAKDNKSRFILANSNVLKSFGMTEIQKVIGKTDFDFMPNENASKTYSEEKAVLESGQELINLIESARSPAGESRWYSINKVPLRDSKCKIIGLVGINRDITQIMLAEKNMQIAKEEAISANRAKSAFLSSMSHEIRTPLNAILGFSQLMLHDRSLSLQQRDRLETINRSGEHLLALINDILEFSKIEAGHISFNSNAFDLRVMLKEINSMFQMKASSKWLYLKMKLTKDLPRFIVADENKLRQILINLIGNAVKFTDMGGIELNVASSRMDNGKINLVFEIIDTGPGIDSKEMKNLFQVFGQSETGIKKGGTGLGLVISRQYARLMGGDINVKSEPGKGSCFSISINVLEGDKTVKIDEFSKKQVKRVKTGQESYRVLVVDDQVDNRKLIKELLAPVGFEVQEAGNGHEAIEKAKEWLPHIILMDMRMPVMNGYEAIRNIKDTNQQVKIPVIAVTASAFDEDRQKAIDWGASGYLRKPFKDYELFECLQSFLGVEYEYQQTEEKSMMNASALTHKSIEGMPDDLADKMMQAAVNLDEDILLKLIDQAVEISPEVRGKLSNMAKSFQYEPLISLFKSRKDKHE